MSGPWVHILTKAGDKDFFPRIRGRIRNFEKKMPFWGDILPILGNLGGKKIETISIKDFMLEYAPMVWTLD